MDLISNWAHIRIHFNRCFRSNFHVSIVSIDFNNLPTVTPIGSLFLNSDQRGFYFEKYPSKLPANAESNKNICVLAINSNTWFWLRSLYNLRFPTYPAIKLYGELGARRKATEIEINRLQRRMKATKWTRGNQYLWGDMNEVREITFTKSEKINIGKMTAHLP